MTLGISIREFARRAGCDDKVVRRKVKTKHIQVLADGSINPAYLDINWRKGSALPADKVSASSDISATFADTKSAALWSKEDAEMVKENYAARLKQLEFDRESAKVVEIDDVVVAVASEYAVVRDRVRQISAVATGLVALRSAEEIKALIDEAVIAALTDLSTIVNGEGK